MSAPGKIIPELNALVTKNKLTTDQCRQVEIFFKNEKISGRTRETILLQLNSGTGKLSSEQLNKILAPYGSQVRKSLSTKDLPTVGATSATLASSSVKASPSPAANKPLEQKTPSASAKTLPEKKAQTWSELAYSKFNDLVSSVAEKVEKNFPEATKAAKAAYSAVETKLGTVASSIKELTKDPVKAAVVVATAPLTLPLRAGVWAAKQVYQVLPEPAKKAVDTVGETVSSVSAAAVDLTKKVASKALDTIATIPLVGEPIATGISKISSIVSEKVISPILETAGLKEPVSSKKVILEPQLKAARRNETTIEDGVVTFRVDVVEPLEPNNTKNKMAKVVLPPVAPPKIILPQKPVEKVMAKPSVLATTQLPRTVIPEANKLIQPIPQKSLVPELPVQVTTIRPAPAPDAMQPEARPIPPVKVQAVTLPKEIITPGPANQDAVDLKITADLNQSKSTSVTLESLPLRTSLVNQKIIETYIKPDFEKVYAALKFDAPIPGAPVGAETYLEAAAALNRESLQRAEQKEETAIKLASAVSFGGAVNQGSILALQQLLSELGQSSAPQHIIQQIQAAITKGRLELEKRKEQHS